MASSVAPQVYLFTGKNTYQLTQRKQRWLREFSQRHGPENVVTLSGATCDFASLLDYTSVAPFLAEKRLTVLEGIPRFTAEQWQQVVANLHPATLLLVIAADLDKRLSGNKTLRELASIEEFLPLSFAQLTAFAIHYAQERNFTLEPAALDALLRRCGGEQWTLTAELEKLSLYCGSRAGSVPDIEHLCLHSGEYDVWALSERLAAGEPRALLAYLRTLELSGEGMAGIWNIFLWLAGKASAMTAAIHDGISSLPAVVTAAGVPFPTAKALLPFCRRLGFAAFREWLAQVTDIDVAMKTGLIRSSSDEAIELTVAAELLLLKACR